MQKNIIVGNVTKPPTLSGSGDSAVCRFLMVANEYAGKDKDTGESKEKTLAIWLTAFRSKAEAIAKHVKTGDQLIIDYALENNIYQKDGEDVYGYNFIVQEFQFGAPGKEKREQLAGGDK